MEASWKTSSWNTKMDIRVMAYGDWVSGQCSMAGFDVSGAGLSDFATSGRKETAGKTKA
jgi:hypothetical protein